MVIAIMDESDRQINFNRLKKSETSPPSGDSYQDESDHQISSRRLQEIYNIDADIYSGSA
jgi:hypothetical protein